MKKQHAIIFLLAALLLIYNFSCTSASKDQLAIPCNTDNMSYANDIVPILRSNCYKCHSAGNSVGSYGIRLDIYDTLKIYTVNNNITNVSALVGAITHNPNYPAMPYKLPASTVAVSLKLHSGYFRVH